MSDRPLIIFGGGVAGLWLLDEAVRDGRDAILLEASALGKGQTIWSQGILHGGLKYTLGGALTRSAETIRDLPSLWRSCLDGDREPDLSNVRRRADHCHLWRTDSLRSRAGMIGARVGLRTKPNTLASSDRPRVLRECPGDVAVIDEQVVCPRSLLQALAASHAERIFRIDARDGLAFRAQTPDAPPAIRLKRPGSSDEIELTPDAIALAAGAGNAPLRSAMGLDNEAMQIRPLRMVLVRGDLPDLNGHCVDGARTRVTITTARRSSNDAVWQIGGQVAEDGPSMSEPDLLAHTRSELLATIPGLDLSGTEWATYQADRAEGRTVSGRRPEDAVVRADGAIVTIWPTKLVLAPQAARRALELLPKSGFVADHSPPMPSDWPRPDVAAPPWELAEWTPDETVKRGARAGAR